MTTVTKSIESPQELASYCRSLAERAVAASRSLADVSGVRRNEALERIADLIDERADRIIAANGEDLARAEEHGLTSAMVDRLRLDAGRIAKMSRSVRQIAVQIDPVGRVIEGQVRPNGLSVQKVRVPLGVVLFIYESRPNVTSDAAALCLRSGNALILRGGKEAIHSNTAIAAAIADGLERSGLDRSAVQLVETTDRAAVGELTRLEGLIDVVIPRGGEGLIHAVVEQSRIPVIKHYTGNCHVYIDGGAPALGESMAVEIAVNAKVQRPGVCNAAESLLVHHDALPLLRPIARRLVDAGVELRGCEKTLATLRDAVPAERLRAATEADWSAEFLDLILAVKIVGSLDEAVDHINRYGSKHTDAIVTADVRAADAFVRRVDSANVMVNCSTRFADGGEYGLGAEIGISTDKLHARGPMGAADLTTYKWVVRGEGQVRS